jgi:hypothetical protein
LKKYNVILLFLLLIKFNGLAQEPIYSLGLWKISDFSGNIKLNGHYRFLDTKSESINETQNSLFYSGGIALKTNNYIWHPNFLLLEIGGEYNPGSSIDNYVVTPDRAETRSVEKLDIKATLFSNKPISLTTYVNLNKGFINREDLVDIRSNGKNWGTILSSQNKIIPFSLSYRWQESDQMEIQTGRKFYQERTNYQGNFSKSFSVYDKSDFVILSNRNIYKTYSSIPTENNINSLRLSNRFFFDKSGGSNFSSNIVMLDQRGINNFNRTTVNERISIKLLKNLDFFGLYNLNKNKYEISESDQYSISGNISHQLYLSLKTSVFYEYSNHKHSSYNNINNRAGINFNYTKKIPAGILNINYGYVNAKNQSLSSSNNIQVYDEQKILVDGQIIFLNNANIDLNTIIVKDNTGTIIYTEDIDYILIESNNFIEIQRFPGGQINDGDIVLVDYNVNGAGSYKYDANNNNFSIRILLFERLLKLYYKGSFQNYTNVEKTDFMILKHFNQNAVGVVVNYKFLSSGVEYEEYKSNINPYNSFNSYLNIQQQFKKFLISVNANYKQYLLLENKEERKSLSTTGRVVYKINSNSRVDIELGYRSQNQNNFNLIFLTGEAEYTVEIRKLYLSLGLDLFQRLNQYQEYKIRGLYCKLVRRF